MVTSKRNITGKGNRSVGEGGDCTLRSSTQGGPQGEGDVGERPEERKGVSRADLWERAFQAEGGAGAKVPA